MRRSLTYRFIHLLLFFNSFSIFCQFFGCFFITPSMMNLRCKVYNLNMDGLTKKIFALYLKYTMQRCLLKLNTNTSNTIWWMDITCGLSNLGGIGHVWYRTLSPFLGIYSPSMSEICMNTGIDTLTPWEELLPFVTWF